MKEIGEYNDSVSEYELFSFLYERIANREILTFSRLREFAAPVFRNKRNQALIMRAFELIKHLYWGFFNTISPDTHEKLWGELVISDKDFSKAGDLKQTLQISNLYIAILDIHGYTQFCMDSRKNLSMLHTLDWAIENEIRKIATACGAISQRERGDEVVVVAASAVDILMATLSIIDYFGKTNIVADPNIPTQRTRDAVALPVFKVTAGITGGNTTSPLIITEKGNLSGFLLNSGARLQNRANELSPTESRVMIAKQVEMNYQKENTQAALCSLAQNGAIYFFDTGHIEFKGVMIPTYEVIFNHAERYKEQFVAEMMRLFASIHENLWEQRIFLDTIDLLARITQVMPKFSVAASAAGAQTLSNDSFINLTRTAIKAYLEEEDYSTAVAMLNRFIKLIELIPSFDRLVLDYLKGVAEKYTLLLDSYEKSIDKQIDEQAVQIFQGNNYKAWEAAKKGAAVYEQFRAVGRKSSAISKKKNLWYNLIKEKQDEMIFTLHSGKK
ncbi:MAG: hypothetical protein LBH97_07385 [Treponema sp.]|nr:hypothetical protein [Treponema sp.]